MMKKPPRIALGISGLPHAQLELKRRHPALSELDDRICQGLDSAACLVVDGRIVAAAAEERFTGEKGTGAFPIHAIEYCLKEAKLSSSDVEVIGHGFNYDKYSKFFQNRHEFETVLSSQSIVNEFEAAGWKSTRDRFVSVDHHLAHAASAYCVSGFESALCIVSDGMGEIDSLSVYRIRDGAPEKLCAYSISSSLGILYSICTRFLGFSFNSDEYKVMGLAAYGQPDRFSAFFDSLVEFNSENGSLKIRWPSGVINAQTGNYSAALDYLSDKLFPPRQPEEAVGDDHADFAAALQKCFSSTITNIAKYWIEKTGEKDLCLAGGSFLNCKANERICNLENVSRVFIQPASGDDGTSIGAAFAALASANGGVLHSSLQNAFNPYLGRAYDTDEVEAALGRAKQKHPDLQWKKPPTREEYFTLAAADIAADKVIAWFNGRMEFGPRALGNRSILALPKGKEIKQRINSLVKFRELFRPFAPAVLDEDCTALFESRLLAPCRYMLCTARAKPTAMKALEGTIHADGSARIQVVTESVNEPFWSLLREVKKSTGYGAVVNTSFNVKGQPLIMDPDTAIDTYLKCGLDALYIEGFVIWK